jgi:GT2 family glycosyltransferase
LVDIPAGVASTGERYRSARVYVWRGGRPWRVIDLPLDDGVTAAELAGAIGEVPPTGPRTAEGSDAATPSTTVVVATRDRPEPLLRCIASIVAGEGPVPEILVVDSAPSDDGAERRLRADAAQFDASIRYVRSARPGLALAHNIALEHVDTDLVLFTDDDVVVDRRWVGAMSRALVDTSAACATGLILPAELETTTQCLIETSVGFDKGFERRLFDLGDHRPQDPLFPFTAGSMGSGANMAFRTEYLRRVGGFDAALGAGSRGLGGDDLAAFMEVVVHGERLVYEPAAVVFHHHHRDPSALVRQARAYGVGMTAAVSSVVVHHPRWALGLARRLPGAFRFATMPTSAKNQRRSADYPDALRRRELVGLAAGPLAYARSRFEFASRSRRHVASLPTTISCAHERRAGDTL